MNYNPLTSGLYRDTTKTRTSPTNGTSTFRCFKCKERKAIIGSKNIKDDADRQRRICKGCAA